jgi:hypothetical protein
MSEEITISPDGARALREAQNFCWRANVAIVAAEHLLAGALLVVSQGGNEAVPPLAALESALMLSQGAGAAALDSQVMFGSSAREAMNVTARAVRERGGRLIDAATIAAGTIDSGEVSPMFYTSLGITREGLRAALMGSLPRA